MNNINKLISENPGFAFEVGEVGIGRPCVGIIENDEYVNYAVYDDDFNTLAESTVEVAPDAYHKHPWCGRILEKGYRLYEYAESKHSIGALLYGSGRKLRAIVDKA